MALAAQQAFFARPSDRDSSSSSSPGTFVPCPDLLRAVSSPSDVVLIACITVQSSTMAAALANGVHENGVADLVDQPAENGTAAVDAIVEPAPRGLYFVRIPKPPMDDTQLKKLQAEFQAHVTKLKGINAKLAAKRVSLCRAPDTSRGLQQVV